MRRPQLVLVLFVLTLICVILGQNFMPFRHSFDRALDLEGPIPDRPVLSPNTEVELDRAGFSGDLDLHPSSDLGNAANQLAPILATEALARSGGLTEEFRRTQRNMEKNLTLSNQSRGNEGSWSFSAVKGTASQLKYSGSIHLQCDMDYVRQTVNLQLLGSSTGSLELEKNMQKDRSAVNLKMSW